MISTHRDGGDYLPSTKWTVPTMRRRFQRYLPIVMIALMVQIFAPIAACWAAAIAVSDPLGAAEICHDTSGAAGQPGDQGGQHREHGSGCSVCCLAAAAGASGDTPKPVTLVNPYRESAGVVWHEQVSEFFGARIGSNAQARAPPFPS
jgi:hypothetical protein